MKLIVTVSMKKAHVVRDYIAFDHFPTQAEMEVCWIKSQWLMPPSFDGNLKQAALGFSKMIPGQRFVSWIEENGVQVSLQEMPLTESKT